MSSLIIFPEEAVMSDVWIGCVRIPDISAWAFQQVKEVEDPFVIVEQGRVVGASRTPRRNGVEIGMTRLRARSLCETATTYPRDKNAERTGWEELLRSLNKYTPRIESEGLGHAWIEPRHGASFREWLDGRRCHCGVAPTRPVSLLAAWKAAPGRIICIEEEHVDTFLSRTPTGALSNVGFSEEISERLSLFGYKTIGSIGDLTRRHLTAQFGEEGGQLYDFLHPNPTRVPFYSPPPAVTATHEFERDVLEPGPLRGALEALAEELQGRLEKKTCQRLTVRLSGRKEEVEASRVLREPIRRAGPIYRAASTFLKQVLTAETRVRSLTLEARGLQVVSGTQKHLFRSQPALRNAISTIQEKYSNALYRVVRNEGAVFEENRFAYEPVAAES